MANAKAGHFISLDLDLLSWRKNLYNEFRDSKSDKCQNERSFYLATPPFAYNLDARWMEYVCYW